MTARGQIEMSPEQRRKAFRRGQTVRIAKHAGIFTIVGFGMWGDDVVYALLASPLSKRIHHSAVGRLVRAW